MFAGVLTEHREHAQHAPYPPAEPRHEPLAYRVEDACRVIGIGRTSLYALIGAGTLTPIRVAGRTLIPADQLRALINAAAA